MTAAARLEQLAGPMLAGAILDALREELAAELSGGANTLGRNQWVDPSNDVPTRDEAASCLNVSPKSVEPAAKPKPEPNGRQAA